MENQYKCRYTICGLPVYQYVMPVIQSNMFIIIKGKKALIVDPHESVEAKTFLQDHHIEEITILLTHEHFDHISGVNFFRTICSCKVIGNKACQLMTPDPEKNMSAFFMAMFLNRSREEQNQLLELADATYSCTVDESFEGDYQMLWEGISFRFVETPGHSMGSVCIVVNNVALFSGDSLVEGAKIITRLPGGSKTLYREKTKPFLESLDSQMIVYPGHGKVKKMMELDIS